MLLSKARAKVQGSLCVTRTERRRLHRAALWKLRRPARCGLLRGKTACLCGTASPVPRRMQALGICQMCMGGTSQVYHRHRRLMRACVQRFKLAERTCVESSRSLAAAARAGTIPADGPPHLRSTRHPHKLARVLLQWGIAAVRCADSLRRLRGGDGSLFGPCRGRWHGGRAWPESQRDACATGKALCLRGSGRSWHVDRGPRACASPIGRAA